MSKTVITMQTRKSSYDEVKDTLGERQQKIVEFLSKQEQGITASELAMEMWQGKVIKTPDRNNVHPRLNELVEKAMVEVTGKRTCTISGKTVAVYSIPMEDVA
ncbi:hypothetical protein [Bacillus toyonensis]|uniref:hypothetical protein n=1 Tax=Bacillus cereus group TaxID=86661 RepID=UPI001298CF59|nr:hypothetical protein [Bacillus thuringiensis]